MCKRCNDSLNNQCKNVLSEHRSDPGFTEMGSDTCQYGGEELLVLAYVGMAVPLPLLYFVREHHLRGGGRGREGGREMGRREEGGGWRGREGGERSRESKSNRI